MCVNFEVANCNDLNFIHTNMKLQIWVTKYFHKFDKIPRTELSSPVNPIARGACAETNYKRCLRRQHRPHPAHTVPKALQILYNYIK